MLPREEEASNLLVVAAPSSSHIGLSTLRMKPQFMMIGHAAGTAAAIALKDGVAVQSIDLSKLSSTLLSEKMILALDRESNSV